MYNHSSGMNFHFTIDVDWIPGSETGLKGLFKFCDKYKLDATLFVAGRFAEAYPELMDEAARRGYGLGTHGWEHPINTEENFRSSTYEQQKQWIQLATEAVEKASGIRPVAFRAPNLWVSETMLRVLEEQCYQFDSSVPARRYDLGYGRVNYTRYFWAPLEPYHPSPDHLGVKGTSPILEIAPSAFLVPINMVALRVMGLRLMTWAVRRISRRSPVLVFYSHPSEFVRPERQSLPPDNPSRHSRGIGPENLSLLAQFVEYVMDMGYSSTVLSRCSYENSDRNDR